MKLKKIAIIGGLAFAGVACSLFALPTIEANATETPSDSSYQKETNNLLLGMYGGGLELKMPESTLSAMTSTYNSPTCYASATGLSFGGDSYMTMPSSMPTTMDWSNYISFHVSVSCTYTGSDNWAVWVYLYINSYYSSSYNDMFFANCEIADMLGTSSVYYGKQTFVAGGVSMGSIGASLRYLYLSVNQDPLYTDGIDFKIQGLIGYNLENYEYNNGYVVGYGAGYDSGYPVGSEAGYNNGYNSAIGSGYSAGYSNGYSDGATYIHSDSPYFPILQTFAVIQDFLELPVFGSFNLGGLLGGMIAIAVVVMFISWFKG